MMYEVDDWHAAWTSICFQREEIIAVIYVMFWLFDELYLCEYGSPVWALEQ